MREKQQLRLSEISLNSWRKKPEKLDPCHLWNGGDEFPLSLRSHDHVKGKMILLESSRLPSPFRSSFIESCRHMFGLQSLTMKILIFVMCMCLFLVVQADDMECCE